MLQKTSTRLTLTDQAMEQIEVDLSRCSGYKPIAALFLETDIDKGNPRWAIRYLDRALTETSDINAALINVRGIELIVPQTNLLDTLNNMRVDWTGSEFTFTNEQFKGSE